MLMYFHLHHEIEQSISFKMVYCILQIDIYPMGGSRAGSLTQDLWGGRGMGHI